MKHCKNRAPIAAVAAAIALIAGASGAWSASTITVHRGAETAAVRPGEDGLVIGRGEALTLRPPMPDLSAGVPDRIAAGRRLWMVDAEEGRVKVCVLARTTHVRGRVIRCVAGDLPD